MITNNNFRITALEDNCVISIICYKDTQLPKAEHLFYKKNNEINWTEFNDSIEISLNSGDYVELYGDMDGFQNMLDSSSYDMRGWVIQSDNRHKISGKLSSLISTEFLTDAWEFASFLGDNAGLVDASDLILPNNTTTSCYNYFLGGCGNLVAPPKVLPAEVVEEGSYQDMFAYDEVMAVMPKMLGKVYKDSACMTTFDGCISLKEALITFKTAESDAFNSTFQNCEVLEKATILCDSIDNNSFIWTFYNCSNLSTVICNAKDLSTPNPTREWLDAVSPTGTFYKAKNANWPTGVNGIPDDWEVKIYVEPKILYNTYTYAKEIYLQISGDNKDYGSKYMIAKKILDAIENYEVIDHIGKDAKEVGMNLFINGDDRYYTFNGTFTSGDYLIGDIKINGVIPAGNYKGFVINNDIAAILEGSNYNCQAVALKKEGEKYVSK